MKDKQYNQSHLSNQNFLTRGRAFKKKNGSEAQKASNNPKAIFTPKSFGEVVAQLPGESQRQYETLRFYCREDSLVKLSKKLVSLLEEGKCPREVLSKRGKFPSKRTLDRWCKKFDWVQRKDQWTHEQCRKLFYSFEELSRKNPSWLTAVKLHQNTTKTPPEMTVKQGQMSANEGSFQGNGGDFGSNEVKSGQK